MVEVSTAKMLLVDGSSWKDTDGDPSHSNAFKLNSDGDSCLFMFSLPQVCTCKLYERAYIDNYGSHREEKAFYETDNACNIEVKVNNSIVDMSALSEVTFDDLFGDDFNGNNTATKDVFLADVTFGKNNEIFYKRVKRWNMFVSAFIFILD